MVRKEKKKRNSQLEWPPNINPLPPLSRTIPSPSQGAPLCVRQSTFGTDALPTHAGPNRGGYDGLAKGFGATYCQPQQTALCAEPRGW